MQKSRTCVSEVNWGQLEINFSQHLEWTAPGCPVDRSKHGKAFVQVIKSQDCYFCLFFDFGSLFELFCFDEIIYTTFDIKSKEAILVLNAFQIDCDHLTQSELLALTLIAKWFFDLDRKDFRPWRSQLVYWTDSLNQEACLLKMMPFDFATCLLFAPLIRSLKIILRLNYTTYTSQ